jgi:hypothetical protein
MDDGRTHPSKYIKKENIYIYIFPKKEKKKKENQWGWPHDGMSHPW